MSLTPAGFAASAATSPNKSFIERGPLKPAAPGGSLPTTEASARTPRAPIKVVVAQASAPNDQQPISLPATVDASGRADNTAKAGAKLNLVA